MLDTTSKMLNAGGGAFGMLLKKVLVGVTRIKPVGLLLKQRSSELPNNKCMMLIKWDLS